MKMRLIMLKAIVHFELHDIGEVAEMHPFVVGGIVECGAFFGNIDNLHELGAPHVAENPEADAHVSARIPEVMKQPTQLQRGNNTFHSLKFLRIPSHRHTALKRRKNNPRWIKMGSSPKQKVKQVNRAIDKKIVPCGGAPVISKDKYILN
jgi:hypothetical protein